MKKSIINNVFPLLAILLLIIIFQKKQNINNKIDINNKNNIFVEETYLDLNEAKNAAKELNKDILLIFETEWCSTCKTFKKESVFENDQSIDDYILCFLDIEKDKEIADQYMVRSLPYYLIVDSEGNVKKKGSGYKSKKTFLNWLLPNR